MAIVLCRGCGRQIPGGARACTQCGAPPTTVSSGSKYSQSTLAAVCCILGPFGIHRFMVGRVGSGILMLCTLCFPCAYAIYLIVAGDLVTGILVLFGALALLGIWQLVDFVLILNGKFTDKQGNVVR